jgi:hypothetical protein
MRLSSSLHKTCGTTVLIFSLAIAVSACGTIDRSDGGAQDIAHNTAAVNDESVIVSAPIERADGTRFVRVFANTSDEDIEEIARQSITVQVSQYTREDYEAMEKAVRTIPLENGAGLGTSYDPIEDVFVVAGSLDEELVAEVLTAYEYLFVYEPEGGRGQ